MGAWRAAGADNGVSGFVFDGQTVTLLLFTEKDWMWRSADDHYRVQARWRGDLVEYRPPFGQWTPLARYAGVRFEGFEALDPAGTLTESEHRLLTPRRVHDYTVKPTDEPSWRRPRPPHLDGWPGLSVRDGDALVDAPEADVAVARAYPDWSDKGPTTDGLKLSIATARVVYHVGEPVRVLHVAEVSAGMQAHIMGPKPAFSEYVDGALRTVEPEVADYPWVGIYDGAVLDGPNPDYNFDVTEYRFDAPGVHEIIWRPTPHASNTLRVVVVP